MTDVSGAAPVPRRGVGPQAVLLAGSTGVAQLITALLFVLAARSTSPEDFGTIAAAVALGTSFVGLIDFGTNGYWVRELARQAMSRQEYGRRLASKLLIAATVAVVLGVSVHLILPSSNYWMAAPVGFALFVNQSAQVPLRGMARTELVSFSVLLDRLLALGVLAIAIAVGVAAHEILWLCLTIGSLAAACVGWLMTPSQFRPIMSFRLKTNPWQKSGFYGLNSAALAAQTLDLPLLALAGGAGAAGLYGAVNRWTQPLGLLISAFSSASAPFVARSVSWEEAWSHVRKALWLPALTILGCIAVAAAAPWVVALLLGDAYDGSSALLRILALAMIPVVINSPLSSFLQSMGHDKGVSLIVLISVGAQLASVLVLGWLYGAVGAAVGFAVLQVVILISMSILALRASRARRT